MTLLAFLTRLTVAGILSVATIGNIPEDVTTIMLEYPGMILGISYLFTGGFYFTLGLVFND